MTISSQDGLAAPGFHIEEGAAEEAVEEAVEEAAEEAVEEEEENHLWPQEVEIQTTETMAQS